MEFRLQPTPSVKNWTIVLEHSFTAIVCGVRKKMHEFSVGLLTPSVCCRRHLVGKLMMVDNDCLVTNHVSTGGDAVASVRPPICMSVRFHSNV